VCEAQGGTLFLDEIEALSTRGQVVLLRFLQDATFRSVGEERRRKADVRVIAASNVDLGRLVECGGFRPDLLYRLNVLSVELPALRDRTEDIPSLASHFLAKAAASEGGDVKSISALACRMLVAHPWPGNVRELEHALRRAHLLTNGSEVSAEDLQRACPALSRRDLPEASGGHEWLLKEKQRAVGEVERQFVEQALVRSNGNISEAARQCHMERAAFSKLVKKSRSSPPIQPALPGTLGNN
jgi:DNA-binding NtrC family response regulator